MSSRERRECQACGGTGTVWIPMGKESVPVPCSDCSGRGVYYL